MISEELLDEYCNFHDDFIVKNSIDFENRKTEIIVKSIFRSENGEPVYFKLLFEDVELQHFENFNDHNIIFSLRLYRNYKVFEYCESKYLSEKKGDVQDETLEKIKNDESFKFYYFVPNYGMHGFIICKNLIISEIE